MNTERDVAERGGFLPCDAASRPSDAGPEERTRGQRHDVARASTDEERVGGDGLAHQGGGSTR